MGHCNACCRTKDRRHPHAHVRLVDPDTDAFGGLAIYALLLLCQVIHAAVDGRVCAPLAQGRLLRPLRAPILHLQHQLRVDLVEAGLQLGPLVVAVHAWMPSGVGCRVRCRSSRGRGRRARGGRPLDEHSKGIILKAVPSRSSFFSIAALTISR